jgi:hypothetical protein
MGLREIIKCWVCKIKGGAKYGSIS